MWSSTPYSDSAVKYRADVRGSSVLEMSSKMSRASKYRCPDCGEDCRLLEEIEAGIFPPPPQQQQEVRKQGVPTVRVDNGAAHQSTYTRSGKSKSRREKSFICDLCGKAFYNKNQLMVHQRIHSGEKPYRCPKCGWRFCQSGQLTNHLRRVDCRVRAPTLALQLAASRPPPRESFACADCEEVCRDGEELLCHRQEEHSTLKRHQCGVCRKCFTFRANLVAHQRTHTGERPYDCPDCGALFNVKSAMVRHRRTHSEERPARAVRVAQASRVSKSM